MMSQLCDVCPLSGKIIRLKGQTSLLGMYNFVTKVHRQDQQHQEDRIEVVSKRTNPKETIILLKIHCFGG